MNIIPQEAVLKEILTARAFPMTLAWSRLEGRPRTNNFDRTLKAEVRDALWMLCKQWQMGEFRGEDAGSPVVAKLCTSTAALTKYKAADQKVQAFDKDVPFDLQHIRVIYYDVTDPFWGVKLLDKVAENILSAIQNPEEAVFKGDVKIA